MLERSILLCMGTRPEIIKMAPVYHELARRHLRPLILHTGQHAQMADQMYQFFDMKPDVVLDLGQQRDTLAQLSSLLLEKLGQALSQHTPATVLVHGDTSSALMAALAAFYQKIPVGHVEAGLRSHVGYDPFPEEKNRELLARLASWHFAPTAQAVRNLLREGIPAQAIHQVGNTIVDAVKLASTISQRPSHRAQHLLAGDLAELPNALHADRRLILVTSHRRENVEGPLHDIAAAVRDVLALQPDTVVVWPVHANPKVQAIVQSAFEDVDAELRARLFLCAPLAYPALIWILRQAWLVLTDSGGIQEEAASVHIPILVLRDTTERPELITSGAGFLVGTNRAKIVAEVARLGNDPSLAQAMRAAVNPFGDGRAAVRIVDILNQDLTDRIAA